jgi:hypothetical protein
MVFAADLTYKIAGQQVMLWHKASLIKTFKAIINMDSQRLAKGYTVIPRLTQNRTN